MRKLEPGHRITVLRDITRKEGPYAKAGETGEVIECFSPYGRKEDSWHAKCAMSTGVIKTFRVSSLQRLDP